MPDYMPVKCDEINDLQFIHGIFRTLKESESLKPRLGSIGKWWRWRGIMKQMENIFDEMWLTIEPAKRDQINAVWANQEIQIVNAGQAVDPTGDYMRIPRKAVVHWGQHGQRESCAMCMGNHADRKDCLFRKGMAEMAIPDLRSMEKRLGKCMGKLFTWED